MVDCNNICRSNADVSGKRTWIAAVLLLLMCWSETCTQPGDTLGPASRATDDAVHGQTSIRSGQRGLHGHGGVLAAISFQPTGWHDWLSQHLLVAVLLTSITSSISSNEEVQQLMAVLGGFFAAAAQALLSLALAADALAESSRVTVLAGHGLLSLVSKRN